MPNDELLVEIIETINGISDLRKKIKAILETIWDREGFECIGLRLKDENGDYPYFEYIGF